MRIDEIFLGILVGYILFGMGFAYSLLREVIKLQPDPYRWGKTTFWITNLILFARWTCAWLPLTIEAYRRRR
jgi:hypothetical protein